MRLYAQDLTVEVSGAGCVIPKACWCCKKFGYHRCKITHNPSGINAEIIQQIWEVIIKEYRGGYIDSLTYTKPDDWDLEEFIRSIEDPRLLAFEFINKKIEKMVEQDGFEPSTKQL